MKLKHIFMVLKKEARDLLRDRKTVITSILLPLVLYPLIFGLMGNTMDTVTRTEEDPTVIAIETASDTPQVRAFLKENIFSRMTGLSISDVDDPIEALRNENVDAVIRIDAAAPEKFARGEVFNLQVIYDDTKTPSLAVMSSLLGAVENFNTETVQKKLADQGIDLAELAPVVASNNTIAAVIAEVGGEEVPMSGMGGMMLSMVLPMLMGMLVAVGGVPAATDLVAGEKERYTFEPLLATRAGRGSILVGKYLAVTAFSILSMIFAVVGMVVGFSMNPGMMGGLEGFGGINLPVQAVVVTLLSVLLLGMIFSAIELAISAFARSFKEAQTYLGFITIIGMVPGLATMMMQAGDVTMGMMFVPLLNTICSIKMVLGGVFNYSMLVVGLIMSLVYSIATLWITSRLFRREQVLFRS